MAQPHEDRERSRRECGSCGHPDHRLVAARAVRVAYGYARAPLLPPDPRQPDHTTIAVADEAEQATKEEAPEVNPGECTHTHRRPIVAPAARVAYGHARPPPLLARRPQCPPASSPAAGAGDHGPPRRRRSSPRTLPTTAAPLTLPAPTLLSPIVLLAMLRLIVLLLLLRIIVLLLLLRIMVRW